MTFTNLLSRNEMKQLIAGNDEQDECSGGSCYLRCDQGSSGGVCVESCSSSEFDFWCIDPSNAVCVC